MHNFLSSIFTSHYWDGLDWEKICMYTLLAVFLIAIATGITLFFVNRKHPVKMPTRLIAYAAISIAASFALSFLKIFRLPFAGSVTMVSVLPLAIFCYYFGFRRGLLVSFIYSVLQILQYPSIVNPFQVILDYILPYTAICLVGLFRGQKLWGFIVGLLCYTVLRYASHFLSGVVFWYMYAPETMNFVLYSAVYNCTVWFDSLFVGIVGVLLLLSKSFTRYMNVFVSNVQEEQAKKSAVAVVAGADGPTAIYMTSDKDTTTSASGDLPPPETKK